MPRRKGRKCHACGYEFAPIENSTDCPACKNRVAHPEGVWLQQGRSDSVSLEEVVSVAGARCDGVFRIVPKADGDAWFTWQFTSGRWADHYLSVSKTQVQGASEVFRSLEGKLDLVDAGLLKPSPDKFAMARRSR